MKAYAALVVGLLVVLAGCAQAPGLDTSVAPDDETTTAATATTAPATSQGSTIDTGTAAPADPDSDRLGWENGYWYNESIDIDQSDGLSEKELEALVSRTMARVEQIRGLEFTAKVPVSILSREEYGQQQAKRNSSAALRAFDNAKFEALFMIGEDTDSIAVQNENSGTSVLGYYSPEKDEIVVISENRSTLKMDEFTLAHELVHAAQDQQFNLSNFDRRTRDGANADSGLIEGDARYTETLYKRQCGSNWSCLPSESSSGGQGQLANIGPYLVKYQPYSDGPVFVRQAREAGGWEAVNALYEDPPASTEQVIHPEKYGQDPPVEVSLDDTSADSWRQITMTERPSYGSVGEAALFSMFMYPVYESQGQTQIIPAQSFFNRNANGDLQELDPFNYSHAYTAGWAGDRFVAYQNDGGETAYVWKLAWDSEADAREFVTGYRKLLEYRNASAVDGRTNTYRIPDGSPFGDAFYVEQQGDTVVIVNAPSVQELPNVREGAAPQS